MWLGIPVPKKVAESKVFRGIFYGLAAVHPFTFPIGIAKLIELRNECKKNKSK